MGFHKQTDYIPDNYRKRQKIDISDEMLIRASIVLTPRQFDAWMMATVHGMTDLEISERMSDYARVVLPLDVRYELLGAASRGYTVPGDPPRRPSRKKRLVTA